MKCLVLSSENQFHSSIYVIEKFCDVYLKKEVFQGLERNFIRRCKVSIRSHPKGGGRVKWGEVRQLWGWVQERSETDREREDNSSRLGCYILWHLNQKNIRNILLSYCETAHPKPQKWCFKEFSEIFFWRNQKPLDLVYCLLINIIYKLSFMCSRQQKMIGKNIIRTQIF